MGVIAVSRQVQTLLFTDIVESTDRLRDLGDAAWAALLARHHEVIRAVLATHGGREVNTVGDGFLARFDAPAPAVRAAAAAVAAVAPLGIEIRGGLHTGEVALEGNEVAGVGVHLAARVMAEAEAGQVLINSTVRDLLAGSGLRFVDLGVRELKGFAERWRLFALDLATVQAGETEPEMWEALGGSRGRTGVPVPGLLAVGRATGYVGREELLGHVAEARQQAATGVCRAVLLCGEPGVARLAPLPRSPRSRSQRVRSCSMAAATRRSVHLSAVRRGPGLVHKPRRRTGPGADTLPSAALRQEAHPKSSNATVGCQGTPMV